MATVHAVPVESYIHSLGVSIEDEKLAELRSLSRLLALRKEAGYGYFVSNFWRGPLLYALVLARRPGSILELGTGRGYGAIAVALAASDAGLPLRIWSIDANPPDHDHEWHFDAGSGEATTAYSVNRFWSEHLPNRLTDRVELLTGDTAAVAKSWPDTGRPPVDFVFIDADHTYRGVKRDFLAALRACTPDALFLFDDYGERPGYGVTRLIERDILPKSSGSGITVLEFPGEAEYDADNDHRMAAWEPGGAAAVSRFRSPFNIDERMTNGLYRARLAAARMKGFVR